MDSIQHEITAPRILYQCPRCDESFQSESILKQHIVIHTKEKHYVCPICQTDCKRRCRLKIHIRTHTGEKPLVCEYVGCGERFADVSAEWFY
ncbi:unnamed protein product [Fusarium graminearum]|uniref:C2H2-type domain-containing protein n=1 Tax=Gibberella zeae TaxID=5518 RepID=A0A9N8WX30_GIBZA|nr:unnamed protein product [Fusarium graminearum]